MSMTLLARTLFQVAFVLGLLTGQALAVPDRPAPRVESPPRDIRIDPIADKILRAAFRNTKWDDAVEKSTYKLLAIEEASGYKRAIAATGISFDSNGEVAVQVIVIAQWTGEKNKLGSCVLEPLGAGPPATLIFDRPIRTLQDIPAAKLRELNWGGLSMNFRSGKKK
jgi:hypothetical protein